MWEKVKLGEIFSVIRNGANIKQSNGASGIPITRIESISSGFLDESKLGYANIDSNKFENFYILRGDILMSHINSLKHLGKTALVSDLDNTIIHGMNLLLLRANQRCFPAYIKYFFETNIFYGQILSIANQSVNQSSFTVNKLKDLEIPLPPLPIQEKIATILDKADELRRKDKDLQSKYDELAQAIFIDMFGDPVRNEKGWEVKKLEELCSKILSGNTPKGGSEVYVESGIKFFRSQNVWKNRLDLDDIAYIDEATHKKMKNTSLKNKDILITKTGRINTENSSLGRAALYSGENDSANLNGHVYLIRVYSKFIIPEFLVFILTTIQYRDHIRSVCVGGIDKRQLNKEHIQDFPIILPPLHLQQSFARKIELINQLKAQANAEKSEELFQSLLQKAFKGELVS
ncbi:MAG: restriction endonuclease subunit [Sphingobacterium multivorum]|jgi:type I restriction enzyme S subunit|nr:restriction endonuclease subunit [Sphingobacterium multivorum]